jgi:glycyl-tRNA synthetase beta chain
MTDFLLELRCEEVPARMQAGARRDLEKLFREHMQTAGVTLGESTVWSTPRRLALIAKGLPDATAAVSEELKGPKLGAPAQALEGFLRKTGLTQQQLTTRDGVYFAVSEKPGRETREVLAEAIPAIIRAFPWPKSQRWGAASISTESLRWVRPLSGIVAIFGQDLVECAVGDVRSGFATKGHRFHAPGEITIGGASDYQDKLRACHVIVDHAEREALIRTKASAAATAAGLVLVEDEGLVIENAGLTEWPVPLLGRFDAEYLEVPPEVIQLTARTNQKYFVCEQHGKLANAFVCTANIEAADGGAEIVSGNRKVLAARLSDARFFWQQDRKKTLAQHAEGLARITFHEKLGTVADKVERVAKLARWLVEEGIVKSSPLQGRGLGEGAVAYAQRQGDSPHPNPSPEEEGLSRAALADQTELAARLCKADLVTEMVGEFPELQGLMGGYYARAEGLDNAVADAIRDHYKPVGQGDDVPTAPVTVAVSLADKLDTLFGFFAIDEKPTGSKDPFALRRASLAIIAVILATDLRFDVRFVFMEIASVFIRRLDQRHTSKLGEMLKSAKEAVVSLENMADIMVAAAREVWKAHGPVTEEQIKRSRYLAAEVYLFLFDRLKVQQRETGVRHDLIDAVFALGGEDDLVRLLARVHALQAFVGSPDGTNLLAGYKRAANILKKEQFDSGPFSLSYMPEPAEQALIDALAKAAPQAAVAVEAERFSEAMAALASLRAPIDAFFDSVTVNDADPQKRAARLSLLAQFRDAVHSVADFSKIEG